MVTRSPSLDTFCSLACQQAAESAKSHGSRLRRGAALPSNPRARWVTQGRQRPLQSNPGSTLFFLTGTSSRRPAFSAACWTAGRQASRWKRLCTARGARGRARPNHHWAPAARLSGSAASETRGTPRFAGAKCGGNRKLSTLTMEGCVALPRSGLRSQRPPAALRMANRGHSAQLGAGWGVARLATAA